MLDLQSEIRFKTGTLTHWSPCIQGQDIMQSMTYTPESHMHIPQLPHDEKLSKTFAMCMLVRSSRTRSACVLIQVANQLPAIHMSA